MKGLGLGLGNSPYLVHKGSLLNQIPNKSDALFWLDGVIVEDGGQKYFRDKTGNNRKFLITDYDFDATWLAGMPYKSAATISAPVGDDTLIAADINNYLYASDGTPNQIPVVSLFQDIDYEHKLFCRHFAQVVDVNGVETQEPRVCDIVLYTTEKVGSELTNCQNYYGVPVEDIVTQVWLSPTGNDTTGNGTKANPYRSLDKIKATTKSTVYLKTGDYTPSTSITFTNAINVIGLGRVSMSAFDASIGFRNNNTITYRHIIFDATASQYAFYSAANTLTINKCKITFVATNAKSWIYIAAKSLSFEQNISINWMSVISTNSGQTCEYKCNLIKGTMDTKGVSGSKIYNNKFLGNLNTATLRFNPDANANLTGVEYVGNTVYCNNNSSYGVYIGGAVEASVNAINGTVVKYNRIININTTTTIGAAHTLFVAGGINHTVKYNYIETPNGYNIVVKSGGVHYSTTDAHISYNVLKVTGSANLFAVLGRGVWGIIVANNTVLDFRNDTVFSVDDDGAARDNSMLCINNLVTLGANTAYLARGTNMTSRNNCINKNGFTLTNAIGANDFEITTAISSNGTPSAKIEHAEEVTGEGNNVGLASNYVIPKAITYQNHGATWQNGAVILP